MNNPSSWKAGLLLLLLLFGGSIAFAQDDGWDDAWDDGEKSGLQWTGFVEGALGSRWDEDPQTGKTGTLREVRIRAETEWSSDRLTVGLKGDALYDDIVTDLDIDIRDLTFAFSPVRNLDVKIGRQVLTWGTGDLLFLNDLFPKDWVSFFAGRDTEYLKAPSDSARFSLYTVPVNVDFAWTPVFEPDHYLTGKRFSFFSPLAGDKVAPDPPLQTDEPARQFSNGEFALRVFRTFAGTEYALYGYRGFFKQPLGLDDPTMPDFPRLTSLGASMRRSQWSGLFNAEASYYFSGHDRDGTDPSVPNDQFRFLLGYEREVIAHFNIGLQYYLEWTQDYDELIDHSPAPQFEPDEYRHVITTRLTWRTMMDQLTWSLFVFYSPSDRDYYLRPKLTWRYSDRWIFEGGANLFGGDHVHTFFSQLDNDSNAYARVRFNY